ncbi:MAG: glycine C-acetyltransferase [Planctomycetota bacterium]|nr:glycine C-acetyltransferase [Planctomycetota bacterium]
MYGNFQETLRNELTSIRDAGLYKDERIISGSQGATIPVGEGEVLNFCANNYLGLSNHPELLEAARKGLDTHGYGMSSVRFICGTQDIHKELEERISSFLGTEDTILYSSCFDANAGLFETLLGPEDAILSDQLNHASIIDGVRLCKARRFRYLHADMKDLENKLQEAQSGGARTLMIATDGVFSMDGDLVKLDEICDLADQYGALVMVDDSHATGFVGATGRGTPEQFDVIDRVDIVTSTLGKALGGASGGFTSGRAEIVELLRQRSRPYLFSNSLPPVIVSAALKVIDLVGGSTQLRDQLEVNSLYFREEMTRRGFDIRPGSHPIIPIMLGDARLAQNMASDLLERGIYVIGFSFPVVPRGEARIRVQISAAHSREDLDRAIQAFEAVGRAHGVIGDDVA